MKKQLILCAVKRGMLGIPLGIAIGHVLTIAFSFSFGDGHYAPCVPQLTESVGSETGAVMLQAALSGLLGAGFASGSVIWSIERLGLVRQTGLYFLANSLLMLLVAYRLYWMEHSAAGFLRYFGIFFLVFAVIWAVEFLIARRTVRKMNAGLRERD